MTAYTQTIATDLIRSAAGDIDLMGIGEFLEGRSIDDPDGSVAVEVDGLIRKATVLVGWSATEPGDGLDLDAIEARVNAATAGPWQHDGNDGLVWPPRIGDPVSGSNEMADADFIAAARIDVPALVAEIKRLREQLGKPCGSCHPCMNWADETWRRADRQPPTVDAYDELLAEVKQLRAAVPA